MSTVLSIGDFNEANNYGVSKYGVLIKEGVSGSESGFGQLQGGDMTYFCANGNAVVVSERADGEAGCTVTWTFDGVEYSVNLGKDTIICGGGWDEAVESTSVTVTGGSVNSIFGGGVKDTALVTASGDEPAVSIVVTGGVSAEGIVGGGLFGNVNGDIKVVIGDENGGPDVAENIIGGGFWGDVNGNITVDLNDGRITSSNYTFACGGGVYSDVNGDITVNINGGDWSNAAVAGGPMMCDGTVNGDITVNMTGGTCSDVVGGCVGAPFVEDDANRSSVTVSGDIAVTVSGGTVTDIVAGGGMLHCGNINGNTSVNITGGTVGTDKPEGGHSYGIFGGNAASAANNGNTVSGLASVSIDTENAQILATSRDEAGSVKIDNGITEGSSSTTVLVVDNEVKLSPSDFTDENTSVYTIHNLEQLKAFQAAVNGGNDFKGKTVILMADIDLNNEEWTPIGTKACSFAGTFDGNGHTVSNLKIDQPEDWYVGFFGYTVSPAVITGLTLDNVDVTGLHCVGGLVGMAYTGKEISDCHITGNVNISGGWYIGGIAGYGYMNLVDNCTVEGSGESSITGTDGGYVGGIWGFRGENPNSITDCSVSNIAITGTYQGTGGIVGIAQYGNTISGCTVSNVSISNVSAGTPSVGLIAGANNGTLAEVTTLLNNSVSDTTVTVGGKEVEDASLTGSRSDEKEIEASIVGNVTYDEETGKIISGTVSVLGTEADSVNVSTSLPLDTETTGAYDMGNGTLTITGISEARIGETFYETFKEAAAAAKADDTITLLSSDGSAVKLAGGVFNNGYSVTITTDGKTIKADWTGDQLWIGRGGNLEATADDADDLPVSTVRFYKANIVSDNYKSDHSGALSYGIRVEGGKIGEKDKTTNNGVLYIEDSSIVTDYLLNQGKIYVIGDGSYTDGDVDLTVLGGFKCMGRAASDAGTDKTALMELTNGAYVIVNNENGMGVGDSSTANGDAYGLLKITDSKFKVAASPFNIDKMGTVQLSGGELEVVQTIANTGKIIAGGTSTLTAGSITGFKHTDGTITGGGEVLVGGQWATATGAKPLAALEKAEDTVLVWNVKKFSDGLIYLGNDADAEHTHTLKIGNQNEEQSFAVNGSLMTRGNGVVEIVNADVEQTGYVCIQGKMNLTDSTVNFSDGEFYIYNANEDTIPGKAEMKLDNSTFVYAGWNTLYINNNAPSYWTLNTAEVVLTNNSTLESKAGIVVGAGGTISVAGSTLKAAGELNNAGTVTLSANSTLKAGTYSYTEGSKITLDASGFTTGYKKVVDLSGTASLEDVIEITNKAENVKVIYGSDGDVALTDQKQNVLYVDSTFKDEDGDGIVDGGTAVLGYNAFTTAKEALVTANSIGGGTIDLLKTGYVYAAPLGDPNGLLLTNAGTYTLTGGNGVLLNYEVEVNPDKTSGKYVLNVVDDAFITAVKITLRYNAEMTVADSRIDYNAELNDENDTEGMGGHSYFSVYNNSTLTVTNSQIGYNPRQTGVEQPGQPATEGVASNRWAFGPTWQIYGTANFTGSQLYSWVGQGTPATGFDVSGAGNATLTSSQLYTAGLNVGYQFVRKYYDYTKENDTTFTPNGLNSTLTLDNTTVMQTQYGNAFNVGSTDYENYTGTLVIKNNSVVNFTARNFGTVLQIGNADSSVTISDSTLKVSSITNKGTITVSGTSTLVVTESVSGKAIELLDGATLKDSTIGFETFDYSNGNMLIDGAVTFSGSNIIRNAEIMVGKGDSLVINDSLDADGTLVQIKAEDGGVITLNGSFTNGSASLEMHGENSIINITQNAVCRPTSEAAAYFTGGTINVTGKNTAETDLANLHTADAPQFNYSSGGWGDKGTVTANFTNTYVKSAMLDFVDVNVTMINSRLDGSMTMMFKKGALTATDSYLYMSGAEWARGPELGKDFTLTLNNTKVVSEFGFTTDGKIIMNGKSVLDAQSLVITVNGSIEMDWNSTLSFNSISAAAGSVTVSLTGYDKTTPTTLFDYTGDETGAPTEEDYKALLGDSWNKNCFSVKDGDLILSTEGEGKITTVYVNSTYTEDNCDGHTFGTNAFASYEDAKAADPLEIITTGGEISGNQGFDGIAGKIQAGNHTAYVYGGNAGSNSSVANDSILTIDGGSFIRVAGGNRVTANKQYVDVTGASTLNINGGTFASVVCAGDHVTNGTVERNNSVALNITGGTFKNDVAGGSVLDLSKSFNGFAGVSTGDITVNISGGTFEKRIYGGNVSVYVAHSGMTKVNGDINITIDATENAVTFKDHIIAGSSGYSMVNGDVSVTLKSSQGNFKFSGILSGGGEGAAYVTSNGVRTEDSYVSGTRSLTFDGFNDSFGGTVFMFNNLSFVGGSQVEFTNSSLKLNDVASWNFGAGSSISGVSLNNFSGDELNIDLKGWDEEEWTVMSGSSAAFTGFSSADVTIDGQDTKWDSDLSAWCTMDEMYKLTLCGDGEDRKLVLTTMIA